MEADWEIEIGPDAPVIEPYWSGFLDLAGAPDRVYEISETKLQPRLAEALIRLNSGESSLWTSKCDVFEPEHVDPGELGASPEEAVHSRSCYIDLLKREQAWNSVTDAEDTCRSICAGLRGVWLPCCRVDLVIRRAVFTDADGLGATVYLTGCGSTPAQAESRLAECLVAFAGDIVPRRA